MLYTKICCKHVPYCCIWSYYTKICVLYWIYISDKDLSLKISKWIATHIWNYFYRYLSKFSSRINGASNSIILFLIIFDQQLRPVFDKRFKYESLLEYYNIDRLPKFEVARRLFLCFILRYAAQQVRTLCLLIPQHACNI